MDNTTTTQLCGCNNCMAIMVDKNPSEQKELTVPIEVLQQMGRIGVRENKHWACPNCKTDGHFIDIRNEEHLQLFLDNQSRPFIDLQLAKDVRAGNYNYPNLCYVLERGHNFNEGCWVLTISSSTMSEMDGSDDGVLAEYDNYKSEKDAEKDIATFEEVTNCHLDQI